MFLILTSKNLCIRRCILCIHSFMYSCIYITHVPNIHVSILDKIRNKWKYFHVSMHQCVHLCMYVCIPWIYVSMYPCIPWIYVSMYPCIPGIYLSMYPMNLCIYISMYPMYLCIHVSHVSMYRCIPWIYESCVRVPVREAGWRIYETGTGNGGGFIPRDSPRISRSILPLPPFFGLPITN